MAHDRRIVDIIWKVYRVNVFDIKRFAIDHLPLSIDLRIVPCVLLINLILLLIVHQISNIHDVPIISIAKNRCLILTPDNLLQALLLQLNLGHLIPEILYDDI